MYQREQRSEVESDRRQEMRARVMQSRLTKRFNRRSIVCYPRMWRTLPHEIITLVVFLHEPRGKIQHGWHHSSGIRRESRAAAAQCRHGHRLATHTSVVTSRFSESIQTSIGHSIGVYGFVLGVLSMIWDIVRGERAEAVALPVSGTGRSTSRTDALP